MSELHSYKSSTAYLFLHSVIQEWLEDCENNVKNPGLVDDVNGMCPYRKTCLKTKICVFSYNRVICPRNIWTLTYNIKHNICYPRTNTRKRFS